MEFVIGHGMADQRLYCSLMSIRGDILQRLDITKVDALEPQWNEFSLGVLGDALVIYLGAEQARTLILFVMSRHEIIM